MIKNLQSFLFAFVMLSGFNGQSQNILLEEDFEDGTLGVFSQYSVIGDNQTWRPGEFGGDKYALMNGFDGGIQDNEDWLISPVIDMGQYADEILTFDNASNFNGPDLKVFVSTNYDGTSDPTTATWTDLSSQVNWSPGSYTFVSSGSLDLSGFNGMAYIAFQYILNTAVESKLWEVDNVVVSAMTSTSTIEVQQQSAITPPVVREGQLQFSILGKRQDLNFSITAIDGQIIRELKQVTSNAISVPVANLPKGAYVLVVRGVDFAKGYKFMVQ